MRLEEEVLYPPARKAIGDDDLLDEAEMEHAGAKELIGQVLAMRPGDELYDAKVTVLGEYIDHHVKEERNEIFVKARAARGLDLMTMRARVWDKDDASEPYREVEVPAELMQQAVRSRARSAT